MKCPNCNETLLMTERQTVEIDYCPSCRGIWLDKGELDKLMEIAAKNSAEQQNPSQAPAQRPIHTPERPHDPYYGHSKYDDRSKYYGKKRKSFLSDIFDFD